MDHQGAATPPADRAYLRDLSLSRAYTFMYVYTYTYTPSVCLIRANDSNVPRDGRRWTREDTRRDGGTRIIPRLVHASFMREAETDYEKGQRGKERRSSVDSIIVGSAPRFAPCKHTRQRDRTRRGESFRGPPGYRVTESEQSLRMCKKFR